MLKRLSLFVCVLVCFAAARPAVGHFVWLGSEKSGEETIGLLFFSEGPGEHDYHLPEPIAEAKLFARTADGKRQELETEKRKTDDYTGLTMKLPQGEKTVAIETVCEYGIYAGSLLRYYSQHVLPTNDGKIPSYERPQELTLDIVPEQKPGGLNATVLWQGKPLADVPVTLTDSTGEMSEEVTDDEGKVFFIVKDSGIVGVMTNHSEKESGEFDGKKYASKSHYATLTLNYKASGDAKEAADASLNGRGSSSKATEAKKVSVTKRPQRPEYSPESSFAPPLPEAITSFGAAVADGWLYVYSGHTGREHQHSRENLSQHFVRLNLASPQEWEALPMQTPLQGMPLVHCDGKLYRVGGMNARNARKEKDDLHSVAEFASFDPSTGEWTPLADLPAGGRSSHDAAVLDGKIYVVGGWNLSGDSGTGEWQNDALVYDPSAGAEGRWQKLAEPPFKRRALAVAAWNGQIWVVGGMDENADIKRDVFFYDPQTASWEQGPELPGDDDMQGFGVSAWGMNSGLYASGTDGVLYRLSQADGKWQEADTLGEPRFFHRLMPQSENAILAIAGASMSDGHLDDIERIEVR